MKTYITGLLTSLALLTSLGTTAQVQSPLSYGIKAGASLSTTSRNNYDTKVGFVGGVVVDYNLSKNLFLRSGLDFVMKGANLTADTDTRGNDNKPNAYYKYEERIRVNYIQLPITFGYKTYVGNGFNAYINAGPYFAYGVYAKGKFSTRTTPVTGSTVKPEYVETKLDSFDDLNFKKFDFGITGSIGVEYSQYFINVGYEYGLTNTAKKTPEENWSWHNMNGTCTLGYKF